MTLSVICHFGKNELDNQPVRWCGDTAKLFQRFEQRRYGDRSGPFVQMVDYTAGAHRNKEGVASVHGFVIDLDHGDWQADDIREDVGHLHGFAWTTHSAKPGDMRWRVVLPFSSPASPAAVTGVYRHFREVFGDDMDQRCEEPAQLWFLPSAPAPAEHHESFALDGEPLDPNDFLELADAPQRHEAPRQGNGEHKPEGAVWKALDAAGMVLGRGTKPGMWRVTCPWEDEHSQPGGVTTTVYWEPLHGGYEGEGFDCKHDHCKGRVIRDVRAKLGLAAEGVTWSAGGAAPEIDEDDPFAWAQRFVLTKQEVAEIEDPTWAYKDLIVTGHVVALVGPPGAGKTGIMLWHVAPELVARGFDVFYVNADTSAGDAKVMVEIAARTGVTLLTPDIKGGSMSDVVTMMAKLAHVEGADYSGKVFIFDTLKKMTEVINKRLASELYAHLRALSGRGMTIVVLGHTNKHLGEDGRYVFEGTGDLRSDSDDLIFLIPKKNPDGSLTISTDPLAPTAKRRGNHQPLTFEIAPDRSVQAVDYVDVAASVYAEQQMEKDRDVIEKIRALLASGAVTQSQIVDGCKGVVGQARTRRVLKTYGREKHPLRQWRREKAFQHNEWRHSPLAPHADE